MILEEYSDIEFRNEGSMWHRQFSLNTLGTRRTCRSRPDQSLIIYPNAHGPSYGGVEPSYGGVRVSNPPDLRDQSGCEQSVWVIIKSLSHLADHGSGMIQGQALLLILLA